MRVLILTNLLLFIVFCFYSYSQVADLKFDHFNIAVSNLDDANREFKNIGFTIKKGRNHLNSIKNSFIEFSDQTEIELINATQNYDKLSNWYIKLQNKYPNGKAALCLLHFQ